MDERTLPKHGEFEMEIATGYFARAKAYAEQGYALISIARRTPWFIAKELTVYSLGELAPTDEILDLKDNPQEYCKRFRKEVLGRANSQELLRQMELIATQENANGVVLMCYEAPDKFCHRHLVAEWLENELGTIINEVHIETKNNV